MEESQRVKYEFAQVELELERLAQETANSSDGECQSNKNFTPNTNWATKEEPNLFRREEICGQTTLVRKEGIGQAAGECPRTTSMAHTRRDLREVGREGEPTLVQCAQCPFSSLPKSNHRSSTMIRHAAKCKGIKPYVCSACGNAFVQRFQCVSHIRSLCPTARLFIPNKFYFTYPSSSLMLRQMFADQMLKRRSEKHC